VAAGYRSIASRWLGGAAVSTTNVAGYRSIEARWLGGASAQRAFPGYRSMQCWWLGGACVSPAARLRGGFQMLAFWMGGGYGYRFFPPRELTPSIPGPPYAQHHEKLERRFIDDEEVWEFIRLWVAWNDIE
jgi:hypothetical protein